MTSFLLYVVMFLADPILVDHVQLQTQEYFDIVNPSALTVCHDGSILIPTRVTAFHFNADGTLIRKVGKSGEGPNHYRYISAITWIRNDKNRESGYYWISDGQSLKTSRICANQKDIREFKTYFENLIYRPRILFGVGDVDLQATSDKVPGWIVADINGKRLDKQDLKDKRFHHLTPEIKALRSNYPNHFLAKKRSEILALNQINPTLFVYSEDYQLVREVPLKLYHFQQAPDQFLKPPFTRERILQWENSWSRFEKLEILNDKTLIAYNIPSSDLEVHRVLAILNQSGKTLGGVMALKGFFLGVFEEHFYTLEIREDTDDLPLYFLKKYQID